MQGVSDFHGLIIQLAFFTAVTSCESMTEIKCFWQCNDLNFCDSKPVTFALSCSTGDTLTIVSILYYRPFTLDSLCNTYQDCCDNDLYSSSGGCEVDTAVYLSDIFEQFTSACNGKTNCESELKPVNVGSICASKCYSSINCLSFHVRIEYECNAAESAENNQRNGQSDGEGNTNGKPDKEPGDRANVGLYAGVAVAVIVIAGAAVVTAVIIYRLKIRKVSRGGAPQPAAPQTAITVITKKMPSLPEDSNVPGYHNLALTRSNPGLQADSKTTADDTEVPTHTCSGDRACEESLYEKIVPANNSELESRAQYESIDDGYLHPDCHH